MARQFTHPSLDGVALGETIGVEGQEAHHAATVSRVRAGEQIRFADGRGLAVGGAVTSASRERVEITVASIDHEPAPVIELWLAQALAKGDRAELAIQAATELGVTGVVPWQAARSVSRWSGPKVQKGVARWQSVVQEAAKQSLRARTPEVAAPVDLEGLVALASDDTTIVVLDPDAPRTLVSQLEPGGLVALSSRLVLVVGPEGGIDGREHEALDEAGAVRARLGRPVLRTSTAGPAAIAVIQAVAGAWTRPEPSSA